MFSESEIIMLKLFHWASYGVIRGDITLTDVFVVL